MPDILMITIDGRYCRKCLRWLLAHAATYELSEQLNDQHIRCVGLSNLLVSFSSCTMLSKTPLADIEGPVWHRFVRFVADDGLEYCGQPDSEDMDGE
jgi:hypothetical protein